MSKIDININTNNVNVENTINNIDVNSDVSNIIVVPREITNIVEVVSPGPQGPPGLSGTGSIVDTGSFVTTSSFNEFTSSYNTGSFTGSFSGDGGGLEGIVSASYAITSGNSISSSYTATASFVDPLIQNVIITGSIDITGDFYQNGVLFDGRYEMYNLEYGRVGDPPVEQRRLRWFESTNINPQTHFKTETVLNTMLPSLYVDILDFTNSTKYTKLVFNNIEDIEIYIQDKEMIWGRVILYSYRSSTNNLRVGGVNLFSTCVGVRKLYGKVSTKRGFEIDVNSKAYANLMNELQNNLISHVGSHIPNFTENYINQNQLNTICTSKHNNLLRFLKIDKYNKRNFSRFYAGEYRIGVDTNGDLRDQSNPYKSKILGTILCTFNQSDYGVSFSNFTTNYGYESNPGNFNNNYILSLFNVYIIETSNGDRTLAVDFISIDQITIPLGHRSTGISEAYKNSSFVVYKQGNTISFAQPLNRLDYGLGITTYGAPLIYHNKKYKTIKTIDVVVFYPDFTCNVFEKSILPILNKYGKSSISYIKLNKNY